MTLSELKYVESEVISLLNQTLDTVKDKSFSDYVLLISRAGYQVENEGTFLSPYVLSSQLEVYQDITRERFSVEYLNSYANLLRDNIFMTDEVKEFNLNLQMMIYAQIWESHRLLKTLLRIGKILAGDSYEWKMSFEYMNEKGKKKAYPKGKIIQDQILNVLACSCPDLEKFIRQIYDSQLRNDFAHASYYIRLENNTICSMDSERYSINKKMDIADWEDMFINSVSLSYHLPRLLRERCNNFINDYPELKSVKIEMPSYLNPHKTRTVLIYPNKVLSGVEFTFQAPQV